MKREQVVKRKDDVEVPAKKSPAGGRDIILGRSILEDPEKLRELYCNEDPAKRMNAKQIAKIAGVAPATVGRYLVKHGLKKKISRKIDGKVLSILKDPEKLRELYCNEDPEKRMSANQIAKNLGCAPSTVSVYLEKYGLKTKKKIAKANKKALSILKDPEKLRELYCNEDPEKRMSANQIAKTIGCPSFTVHNWLNKHGIQKRDGRKTDKKKISILEDKEKLNRLYWEDGMTINQIARKIGCSNDKVIGYFRLHGIKSRNRLSEQVQAVLEDREKLRQMYWDEEKPMSAKDIAMELGCDPVVVGKWLDVHGIIKRTNSEAVALSAKRDIPLSSSLRQFLDGSLLGDGHMAFQVYQSCYQTRCKHEEYIEYIELLFQECGYETKKYTVLDKKLDNYMMYVLRTQSTTQLHEYREKWYPDGKKIVPEDLELTPAVCQYWYLEDGSLSIYKYKEKIDVSQIYLATNGFSSEENKKLIVKLKKVLQVKDGILLSTKNEIYLNKQPTLRFLKYISSKSPVRCFDYKFDPKLPRPKSIANK
ncbi:MAG: hypothetical protein ACXAEU_03800 [Candidatus Hodarchaeales archaeon]